MRFQFSTDNLPERDRFAYWAEELYGKTWTQRLPVPDAAVSFHADMRGRSGGPMSNIRVRSDNHIARRQPSDIARRDWNNYWLYRQTSAVTIGTYGAHEMVIRAGDIFLLETDIPYEVRSTTDYHYDTILVPKSLVRPHLPAGTMQPRPRKLTRAGVSALAVSYIETLLETWDKIPDPAMEGVADTLGRLLGVALGADTHDQPDAIHAGRLNQVRRYIETHLGDPALSVASVAAANGMSVRALHLLFEPTGTTFARHVLRRRLEECRTALLNNPARSVTDIAFAWGFGSLSGFYRAFQAAFDMAPGDLRATAMENRPN